MTFAHPNVSSDDVTDSSPSQTGCISLNELQDYLAGWSNDTQCERIENHLAACTDCDLVLRSLEIRPDTLTQSLQSTAVESTNRDEDIAGTHDKNHPISAVVARSRKLMDGCPGLSSADRAREAWQPPGQKLGGYELLRPLGRGGMGAVYLANHSQLNRQVAIKLLPKMSADDADVRARFQREIRVVGRLNHPSIVAATDAGEIDGTQFLVMEYVPGLDLSHVARLLGKLPLAEACELMRQVTLGLSCAHAEGVVHRDVKPSNLMLDEAGQVKILDFGLAQLSFWNEASVELTTVGQLMGTLDYMAPEQAEYCGGVDHRADLYAMGATLFRLLCGRPPLAAAPNQSPLEKLRLLANHQPPNLDTLCPTAPAELDTLVGSLLARNPQDRPASAAHVAERLAEFTQSADLVGLLGRAREAESQSPLPERGPEQRLRQFGLNTANDIANDGNGNGNRVGRWIAAAFALPILIVAEILIRLETDKGQLVIESEVSDIEVHIVGDAKPAGEISIKQGATATRLRAGKYELIINGKSDELTIDNRQFTIQNGGTVVAWIRLEPRDKSLRRPSTAGGVAVSTAEAELKPLYEGKPLSEWLRLLGRERSITGLKAAFNACIVLTSPQTSDRITKALLKTVPGLNGQRDLSPDANTPSKTIDRYTSEVLRKANPGPTYFHLWVKEFESADVNWRKRLWSYHDNRGFGDDVVMELFVAWAERYINQPSVVPLTAESDTVRAADSLRLISRERENNPQLVERIVTALKS
ncbi:MAG: serine/threonine-protein kinase, partial [Fuerstiella sp.]